MYQPFCGNAPILKFMYVKCPLGVNNFDMIDFQILVSNFKIVLLMLLLDI